MPCSLELESPLDHKSSPHVDEGTGAGAQRLRGDVALRLQAAVGQAAPIGDPDAFYYTFFCRSILEGPVTGRKHTLIVGIILQDAFVQCSCGSRPKLQRSSLPIGCMSTLLGKWKGRMPSFKECLLPRSVSYQGLAYCNCLAVVTDWRRSRRRRLLHPMSSMSCCGAECATKVSKEYTQQSAAPKDAAGDGGGCIDQFHAVAGVRAITAVARNGLCIGHSRQRQRHLLALHLREGFLAFSRVGLQLQVEKPGKTFLCRSSP